MAEDMRSDEVPETDPSALAHDDIMKRVVEYQRRLRAGEPASLSTASEAPTLGGIATEEIVAVTVTGPEARVEIATRTDDVETDIHAPESELGSEPNELGIAQAIEPARYADALFDVTPGPSEAGPDSFPGDEAPVASSRSQAGRFEPSPLEERVARLESTLETLGSMLRAFREDFQELVIKADHRVGSIEDEIERGRDRSA